ncbi:hypothetical protein LXD69_12985 [Flavobacterium sediminilitoris]|uniref:HNH endonuclease n=1 Tax=Flavobacterium sediminilitoris TaxID=2024526 RepID=A0ABY4HN78_9FLAO|nr:MULTISPECIES: hypothetical protein [Flavobacterium]UOX32949.1 hypothetical protein LXD69_12985 [Flavobacterium sediminilitoris]
MKNLNNISTENLIDWYTNIVNNKDHGDIRDNLLALTDDIKNRFDDYIDKFSSSELITIEDSLYIQNHPNLVSCYKSEGNTLKLLKKAIKDNQDNDLKGVCQYCGILKPKTYDHYLPISIYPEFSALAINLIPCCKDCNGKKKNYWKENQERGIINFYIDNIPDSQFLFGNVIFVSGIPHIEYQLLNPNNIINSFFFDIAKKHYKRLELLQLFKDTSTDELGEMIRMFKIYVANPTVEDLSQKLNTDANQLQMQFGLNYWKAVMRLTLSQSEPFLNYLINQINK